MMTNGNSARRLQVEPKSGHQEPPTSGANSAPTSPICRCRVMYLGSSVPHETKDGLQGIQQPLRELYPDRASLSQGNAGIDSWLSVWSNGILIENVDETGREVKKFFKIEALHYCAAVKFVPQAQLAGAQLNGTATLPHNLAALPKFLPLDSPQARLQQDTTASPPIFASILRRTTGVKVLECHAFICKREAAANALVRCCFHAYADTMYAKQIGAEIDNPAPTGDEGRAPGTSAQTGQANGYSNGRQSATGAPAIAARRSKSIAALNDVADSATSGGEYSDSNHRPQDFQGAVLRRRSLNNGQQQLNYANSGDISDGSQQQQHGFDSGGGLQGQKYSSKSMHQLNQAHLDQSFNNFLQQEGAQLGPGTMSTSYHNLARGPPEPIFSHNPYASRVPSYPPQNIIDQQQQQQQQQQMQALNGGTLRSVKSVAANSIASTLLRSKKHAKAMSMAQLNSQHQQMMSQPFGPPVTSFHQPPQQAPDGSLYGASFLTLPPVPPMFLPSVPRHINGSQTMKLPSRGHLLPQLGAPLPMNFEAMTPKEMKKLLKKGAKYGLDPSKFADNGLPLMPLRPMPMGLPPPPPHLHQVAMFGLGPQSASGTLNSAAMFPLDPKASPHDMPDLAGRFGPPVPMFLPPPPPLPPQSHEHFMDPHGGPQQPIKSILVKPNPEFLKSKAGKKWLKQQKEFKKLLPSHLDGLPIVFGPPPVDMLDPATGPGAHSSASSTASSKATQRPSYIQPPPPPHLPPPPPSSSGQTALPVLDSNGFYSPHPLYGPSGRASAASTLMRNSPQVLQQQQQHLQLHDDQLDHHLMMQQRHHQSMYSNPILMAGQVHHHAPPPPPPPPMLPPHLQPGDDLYGGRAPASQLSSYDQQFGAPAAGSSARRRRNHMVRERVISLGDEENEDDDDHDGLTTADERFGSENGANPHSTDGYYNQLEAGPEAPGGARQRHRRRRKSSSGEQQQQQQQQVHHMGGESHLAGGYQDDYELINSHQQMTNEDRNSNSSGIYRRRGHINERAFSYSIRQEASKSSADNSDAEYRNGDLSDSNYQSNNNNNNNNNIVGNNNNYVKYRLSQQQMHNHHHHQQPQPQQQQHQQRHDMAHYDNPQQQAGIYQDRPSVRHYKQHPSQQQSVDELSSRIQDELNMKPFPNPCVKSHM